MALTDHGNMSGSAQLYKECLKAGIKPFPGSEFYLVKDRADKKAKRYHIGLVAYTTIGYRNLVHISTRSHQQFYHRPLLDLADLAELSELGRTQGIALTTGCFFSLVVQTLITEGYTAAKATVAMLASWFETYVEIQAHEIDHGIRLSEDLIARLLFRIAGELKLPVVVTQDSHYTTPDEKKAHEALKRLVAWGPEPDDAVFPGDSFHLASEAWVRQHHRAEIFEAGLAGLDLLLAKHDMAIAELDEYRYRVPQVGGNSLAKIRDACELSLIEHGLGTKEVYLEQLETELEILAVSRMADYIQMVKEVCDHMRKAQMFFQIRGSAGGSLICYLLRITNVDPLVWKLRFDRFLSKDRMKPPDIDIDVEHDRRQELITWIGQRFSVVQICTFGTYSITGEDAQSTKGSLKIKYLSRKRKTTGSADWSRVTVAEMSELNDLSSRELVSSVGVHAAGLVICSSSHELGSLVPMQWVASSKTMVSQYDGDDCEAMGLVKLDVLGVKTLSVLRRTILNLKKDPRDGLDFIPFNDRKALAMIRKGDTSGIFQLEGYTSTKNVTRLKPTKLADVIAAMALFRPGVMDSGAMETYLARKSGRERLPARHQIIARHTKETYGILLYQDQVIQILRDLGFGPDDLTAFLKAVKASNKNVEAAAKTMATYSTMVAQLCELAGMSEADQEWLWDALKAFAEYSFNRAHATIYGITAYRCAFLAANFPVEFHAALLAVAAGSDKETKYMTITVDRGVALLKPDVNSSGDTYTVDPNGQGIRRGLISIKGVGPAVCRAIVPQQPFTDLKDFATRVNPRVVSGIYDFIADGSLETGKMKILYEAKALDSLEPLETVENQ